MTENNVHPIFHHDSRPYAVVAAEAKAHAEGVINTLIDKGRGKATAVFEKIMNEVPKDRIAKGSALTFEHNEETGLTMQIPEPQGTVVETLHRNAFGQLLARAGIPMQFHRNLEGRGNGWASELMAHNLNEIYSHSPDRHLVRSYGGQTRGVLSDKYRRLDSRPLIEAFADSVQNIGAVPVDGLANDTKVSIKALLPEIYEPAPNEVIAFGLQWENSDYGNGAHCMRAFMLRLWCTNFAIADTSLRQVHLGKRLSDDIVFSEETYRLDTAANASALKDMVKHSLSADTVKLYCDAIKNAHEEKIDVSKAVETLKKRLTKGEVDQVVEAFNSPDVEMMPAGNSKWRLSNALSWVAGQLEDGERALELQAEAGRVIPEFFKAAA